MSAVYVWIETYGGKALPTSWEALAAGKMLAGQYGVPLIALVFGANASAIAGEAGTYGATQALISEDATLAEFRLEPYAALVAQLVTQNQPKAVIAVATSRARELLPAVAADTDGALLSDVLSLNATNGAITAERSVYSGKVLSDEAVQGDGTLFVTLRSRAYKAEEAGASGAVEKTTVQPVLTEDQIATKQESFEEALGTVNLSDAAVIVSGGRAMANNPKVAPGDAANGEVWKAQEGFKNTLQPLADVLGAALGASRAAVDAGYIPYAHQVGQTGRTVSPDVYIAAGISGAIQHQAGMRGSKIIVAINKDPEAPIFKMARYGLVGDLYQIIPAITEELKRRLGK